MYEVSSVVQNRKLPSEAGVTWSGALQTIYTTFWWKCYMKMGVRTKDGWFYQYPGYLGSALLFNEYACTLPPLVHFHFISTLPSKDLRGTKGRSDLYDETKLFWSCYTLKFTYFYTQPHCTVKAGKQARTHSNTHARTNKYA